MFAIVAVDEHWGIGCEGDLLFHISADMKRFRQMTTGHSVVMGRKTLLSFPGSKPLPKRRNIVLSRDMNFAPEGVEMARSVEEAVAMAEKDAFCIGGGAIYAQMLPHCERVYVTKVFSSLPADTRFPNLDDDPAWTVAEESEVMEENGVKFQYVDYMRA